MLSRMSWLLLGVLSAVALGIYDLMKKTAVNGNAVLPVLFLSSLIGGLIWMPAVLISTSGSVDILPNWMRVDPIGFRGHGLLFLKAVIVAASWVSTYFALKHLPISIASPIRSTAPLWTLIGALVIYREAPSLNQALGIGVTLVSFILLSLVGKGEGIHFSRNGWVGLMVLGTVIGSVSALYDKYLLGHAGLSPSTTQAWFSIYLGVVLLVPAWGWLRRWWPRAEFHWRWSIPFISVFLLLADYAYFSALKDPDALISVLSSLRRANVLVTVPLGVILFREKRFRAKLPCVIGILAGACLILS